MDYKLTQVIAIIEYYGLWELWWGHAGLAIIISGAFVLKKKKKKKKIKPILICRMCAVHNLHNP